MLLFEEPVSNVLQKESPTIMSAGDEKGSKDVVVHDWGLEGIVCQRAIDPRRCDCICDHRRE